MLAEGYAANPSVFRALQQRCRFSVEDTAAACLVAPRTVRRWRATGRPDPTAVRLLAILAGFVPWVGWNGWEVHNGYLFPPGEFFALVFYRQQVSAYQEANAALRARVSALETELAARSASTDHGGSAAHG